MVFRGSIGGTAPQCDLEPERWLNGWRPANPRLDPTLRTGEPFGPAPMGADVEMAPISSRRAAGRSGGPVVQWSERAAHNGVVAGSNPAGPTILLIDRLPRARGAGRYGLDIRTHAEPAFGPRVSWRCLRDQLSEHVQLHRVPDLPDSSQSRHLSSRRRTNDLPSISVIGFGGAGLRWCLWW